ALVEQLGHVVHHVLSHGFLVFADRAVDLENRHAPFVFLRLIERDHVGVIRNHLSESCRAYTPFSRYRQRVFELTADSELCYGARPSIPSGAALITKAAQIMALVPEQISVARNVETVWPATEVILVVQSLELARCAHAE